MAKMSFSGKGGRIRRRTGGAAGGKSPARSAEDAVRELKAGNSPPSGEDYRERSLAIHGLVCARCGREFSGKRRHLLTVHHRDGDHHNNPSDGSNWENLCVDCHDDVHSRTVHGEYVAGGSDHERRLVYGEGEGGDGSGGSSLGDILRKALEEKKA